MKSFSCLFVFFVLVGWQSLSFATETLPPIKDGKAPQSHEDMWRGFDPRAEPLEVEVLKEWEEDGVVLKVLRYRIGVFKGKKAGMAAVYGYPKGVLKGLPGLVQKSTGRAVCRLQGPLDQCQAGICLDFHFLGGPDFRPRSYGEAG